MMGVFVQVNEDSPQAKAHPLGYVIEETGCWSWVGAKNSEGYGSWWVGGRHHRAHRVMYERTKGPIPDGLVIDHLCRNRDCVNPDHLEVVTNRENIMRGEGYTAQQVRKTHCKRGHQLNEANIARFQGRRSCRACRYLRDHNLLPEETTK